MNSLSVVNWISGLDGNAEVGAWFKNINRLEVSGHILLRTCFF